MLNTWSDTHHTVACSDVMFQFELSISDLAGKHRVGVSPETSLPTVVVVDTYYYYRRSRPLHRPGIRSHTYSRKSHREKPGHNAMRCATRSQTHGTSSP
jgi:hypothetical protein